MLLLYMLIQIVLYSQAQWNVETITSPLLPQPLRSQAVFSYNGTIRLFGGVHAPKRAIDYDITSNSFGVKGLYVLPYECSGGSQYYTQINHKLYWIGLGSIYSYDHIHNLFNTETSAPTNIADYACLTSHNDLLFVLGGFNGNPMNTVQVLNISSNQWIRPVDPMISNRRDFSCEVDPVRGVVYAISGNDGETGWITDIDTLEIGNDVTTASWAHSGDLLTANWGSRAVYIEHDDSILVIIKSEIERIDCNSGEVLWMTNLNYDAVNAGVIFVENVLYVFGGSRSDDSSYQTWQYITHPLILKSLNKTTIATVTTTISSTTNTVISATTTTYTTTTTISSTTTSTAIATVIVSTSATDTTTADSDVVLTNTDLQPHKFGMPSWLLIIIILIGVLIALTILVILYLNKITKEYTIKEQIPMVMETSQPQIVDIYTTDNGQTAGRTHGYNASDQYGKNAPSVISGVHEDMNGEDDHEDGHARENMNNVHVYGNEGVRAKQTIVYNMHNKGDIEVVDDCDTTRTDR